MAKSVSTPLLGIRRGIESQAPGASIPPKVGLLVSASSSGLPKDSFGATAFTSSFLASSPEKDIALKNLPKTHYDLPKREFVYN